MVTLFLIAVVIVAYFAGLRVLNMTPDQIAQAQWGTLNPAIVCPHCQTKGTIHTKAVRHKEGVSGAKATAAVLTAGTSLLVAGLSRMEDRTQAHCMTCKMTWLI